MPEMLNGLRESVRDETLLGNNRLPVSGYGSPNAEAHADDRGSQQTEVADIFAALSQIPVVPGKKAKSTGASVAKAGSAIVPAARSKMIITRITRAYRAVGVLCKRWAGYINLF